MTGTAVTVFPQDCSQEALNSNYIIQVQVNAMKRKETLKEWMGLKANINSKKGKK